MVTRDVHTAGSRFTDHWHSVLTSRTNMLSIFMSSISCSGITGHFHKLLRHFWFLTMDETRSDPKSSCCVQTISSTVLTARSPESPAAECSRNVTASPRKRATLAHQAPQGSLVITADDHSPMASKSFKISNHLLCFPIDDSSLHRDCMC